MIQMTNEIYFEKTIFLIKLERRPGFERVIYLKKIVFNDNELRIFGMHNAVVI